MKRLRAGFGPALVVLAALVSLLTSSAAAFADDATPTPTPTPTATPAPTATDTPLPTSTAVPSSTATSTPRVRVVPTRETRRRSTHHTRHTAPTRRPTPGAAKVTPTPTPNAEKHHAARHHRARTKPTATATPVPALSLSADDSVKPVTCNRGPVAPAPAPFLLPPYHGWTSIVSYMDHDLPDFVQDGSIITAGGMQAAPDQVHQRSDFPAYWNPDVRQYIYYDGHNGYDFNVWYQPLYAAAAGKVIFARLEYPDSPHHGYGLMVMIQHRHGYVTLYGHMSKLLVHAGEKVQAGQKIGISGNTGHSTGPHVHFTVFHNCTPTDPYGWSGPGSDPLSAYQGETSEFLWIRAPLVVNPPPSWPGARALPAPPAQILILLRLPSTSGGTDGFLTSLHTEADLLAGHLRTLGESVREDLLRGLLEVEGPVKATTIYAQSDVASISSPDTIEGAKADMLAALARAALVRPAHALVLSSTHRWSGSLLRWDGRTLLVGRGSKGATVSLRLSSGRGGSWHTISTDPRTGAYAIDLGPMSARQYQHLRATLQQRQHQHGSGLEPVAPRAVAVYHSPGRPGAGFDWWLTLPVGIFAGAVAASVLRRKFVLARPGGNSSGNQVE